MAKLCVLECIHKDNCKRKRRVADPNGYCRYQTPINVSKVMEIANRIVENKNTEVKT